MSSMQDGINAVARVILSGPALSGVEPSGPPHVMARLPKQVALGRRRPPARPQIPGLSRYVKVGGPPPPASTNWRDKAKDSIARTYLNDTYGDCVIAGKAHALGVWSANDPDSGGLVLATDQEIYSQYQGVCGPGDNGCYIPHVLDYMRDSGFVAGGKRYKIDGYVSCDWTNKLEVQVAQYLFGATTIGINLPDAWTRSAVWDITNTAIVGGHDVTPIDYDEQGVYVSSWGRIYRITWAAFLSTRWLEEMYVLLAPLWYGNDKLAPNGIDVATLKADMDAIGSGQVPPLPDPTPPPVPPSPPSPPVPPSPPPPPPVKPHLGGPITLSGQIPAGMWGTMRSVTFTGTGDFHESDAVTGPTSPATVNWRAIPGDVWALFAAWRSGDPVAMLAAGRQLLTDLGVLGFQSVKSVGVVDFWTVLGDVGDLLRAVSAKDWLTAYAAARKLLTDLGVNLPF